MEYNIRRCKNGGDIMGYTSSNTALLAVDIQKGLFRAATSVYKAEELLNTAEKLLQEAREAGIQVVHVQRYNEILDAIGEKAINMHPRISFKPGDLMVRKEWMSAFHKTNLHEVLQRKNIERIVVMGLVTQGAIKATCLQGKELGYEVVLVANGHSNNNNNAQQIIKEWNETLMKENISVLKAEDIYFL